MAKFGLTEAEWTRLKDLTVWMVLLALFGAMAAMAFSPSGQLKQQVTLGVTATGDKNQASQGAEVWIRTLGGASPGAAGASSGWESREERLVWPRHDRSPAYEWRGELDRRSELIFDTGPWSGIAEVTLNGRSQRIDLYSAAPGTYTLKAHMLLSLSSSPLQVKLRYAAHAGLWLALSLAIVLALFYTAVKYDLWMPMQTETVRNADYVHRLDHLRFMAALLVIVYHFFYNFNSVTEYKADSVLSAFISEGHTGVGLFMVISGFVFGVIGYRKNIRYGPFLLNRVLRIYPLYLSACLIAFSAHRTEVTSAELLFYLFPFLNSKLAYLPLFGQLWSIAVEFTFYLIFPFLNRFVARYGIKYIVYGLILSVFLKACYYAMSGSVRDLAYWTILGRIDQFLIGMLLAHVFLKRDDLLRSPVHLLLSSALVLGVIYRFNAAGGYFQGAEARYWIVWPMVEALMWGYFALSYVRCSLPLPRWADTALARLGAMSFSLYVMHNVIIAIVVGKIGILPLFGSVGTNIVLTALLLVVPAVCVLSYFTYTLIERPFAAFRQSYTYAPERRSEPPGGG